MRVRTGIQFAVCLPNRPGSYGELCKKLAARDVRIDAFMLYTNYVMAVPPVPLVTGTCKIIVENDQKAREVFHELGIKFREQEVILLREPDQRGGLASILGRLAEAGLNVKEGYTGISADGKGELIVLAVSDIQRGLAIADQFQVGLTGPQVVSIRSNRTSF